MIPKEKENMIVEAMLQHIERSIGQEDTAKLCALVAVEEVIETLEIMGVSTDAWKEVKDKLEKQIPC